VLDVFVSQYKIYVLIFFMDINVIKYHPSLVS